MKTATKQPNFKKRKVDPRARTQRYPSEQSLDAIAAKSAEQNGHASRGEAFNIPLTQLEPSPTNPRRRFDEAELQRLADDLRVNGLIQAVVVRLKSDEVRGDNKPLYEILCGERRFLAARRLGWAQIRCRVVNWPDDVVLERQIAENDQRSDLTEIERAEAYQRLLDTGLTQEQLAAKLGRTQGFIANAVGLLKLPKKARAAVEAGVVSATCARLLVPACHVPAIVDDMLKYAGRQVKENGGSPATVNEWESKLDTVIINHTVPLSGRKWVKDERCGGSMSKEWRVPVTEENREALALVPGKYGKRSANPKLVAKLKAEQTRKANARAAKGGTPASKKAKGKEDAAKQRRAAEDARRAIERNISDLRNDLTCLAIAQSIRYLGAARENPDLILRLVLMIASDSDSFEGAIDAAKPPKASCWGYADWLEKVPAAELPNVAVRFAAGAFASSKGEPPGWIERRLVDFAARELKLNLDRVWRLTGGSDWLKKNWAEEAKDCGRDEAEQQAGPPAKCPEWLLPKAATKKQSQPAGRAAAKQQQPAKGKTKKGT